MLILNALRWISMQYPEIDYIYYLYSCVHNLDPIAKKMELLLVKGYFHLFKNKSL
jgi:hypothetical protein